MYQKKKGNIGLLGRKNKDQIYADNLDFSKKILHSAWHPSANIIALAATNTLYLFDAITC